METKKKEENIIEELTLDLLDSKSRDITEFSPVVRIGMAKLILAYRGEKVGVETSEGLPVSFQTYLEEANIPYNKTLVEKALRILEDEKIIVNGKISLAKDEDIESPVTWALWACVLDEMLEVSYDEKTGQRRYRNNEKGMKEVEKILKENS